MKPEEFDTTLEADRGTTEPAMMVDVEGFEGPLDLLLALARTQKVDLAKISILALADQYLSFIEAARQLRLELAADYLVMAAWLAYLKSRLLLPDAGPGEGPSAEVGPKADPSDTASVACQTSTASVAAAVRARSAAASVAPTVPR